MRTTNLAGGIAIAALLAGGGPATAEGKADRARSAIAVASAKIDAANKVGATGEVPRMQAAASAALREAQEDLSSGLRKRQSRPLTTPHNWRIPHSAKRSE